MAPPSTASLDSRRIRYNPSRANSSAAAASPNDSSPPSMPSRPMILARPGTSPIRCSRSAAGTRSPDSTLPPPSKVTSNPVRSALPSLARKVSATARRSRCSRTSCSRPSSLTSNSTLPRSVLTVDGRSQIRATGCASPVRAARRSAEAATDSAAAIANRADTPDRESTAGDERTSLVNRAMISIRCSGRAAPGAAPPHESSDSCVALLAGISRSGVTMVAGMYRGLSHEDAARFAFLLATPVILAAGVLKIGDLIHKGHGIYGQILLASLLSGVGAYVSVRFLVKYFQTRTLTPFGIYCVVFGLGSVIYLGLVK